MQREMDAISEVERESALVALASAVRLLAERVRTSRASKETLDRARASVDRIAEDLAPFVHPGPHAQADQVGGSGRVGATSDPMALFPWSPICGRANPIAPPAELWVEDGVVHGRANFGPLYCGPPNHVHGGVLAAVMDELLGVVNVVNDLGAMTGTLKIRYLRPTPLGQEIRLEGRSIRQEGRKIFAEGWFSIGGERLVEAEGVFIQLAESARERLGWASLD